MEVIKKIKARLSMVWHALTAKECIVVWISEDDKMFYAHETTIEKWNGSWGIEL